MSKINQSKNCSSISQKKTESSVSDSSKKIEASYIEKGFYSRDIVLLINEASSLITTEKNEGFLLEIESGDTIQVSSTISENK